MPILRVVDLELGDRLYRAMKRQYGTKDTYWRVSLPFTEVTDMVGISSSIVYERGEYTLTSHVVKYEVDVINGVVYRTEKGRVGPMGLQSEYEHLADGKRISFKKIMKLIPIATQVITEKSEALKGSLK